MAQVPYDSWPTYITISEQGSHAPQQPMHGPGMAAEQLEAFRAPCLASLLTHLAVACGGAWVLDAAAPYAHPPIRLVAAALQGSIACLGQSAGHARPGSWAVTLVVPRKHWALVGVAECSTPGAKESPVGFVSFNSHRPSASASVIWPGRSTTRPHQPALPRLRRHCPTTLLWTSSMLMGSEVMEVHSNH